jgi:ABC-type uncharacterized transport system involved in gliding motility auxiliary subunit
MERRRNAVVGIVLLVVLFLSLSVVADAALRRARVDLTESGLFTLSTGTRAVLRDLDEPITLSLFFSESVARGRPMVQTYAKRVRELLEEFELRAGGTIILETLDAEPFSEAEERAQREGLRAIPVAPGEALYFGLVGTNSTSGREVIPFFDPAEERFLEYQLTRVVHKLSTVDRPSVAVYASIPVQGSEANPLLGIAASRPWLLLRELGELFDLTLLEPDATEVPPGTDLVLLIHPKNVPDALRRSIDAFVLGGGPAVVCVDPLCDADIPPGAQQDPMALMRADRSSDLPALLRAWGVRLAPGKVAADLPSARRGPTRGGRETIPYVQYLALGPERLDADDAVTGSLSLVQVGSAGSLEAVEGATTTLTPLVTTSDDSMLLDASRVGFLADQRELVAGYEPSGGPLVLAARITGPARTAFPDPPEDGSADEADGPVAPDAPADPSEGEIAVVVVADVDMLTDRFWAQEMRLGEVTLGYQKQSDNADLIVNAVDQMAGSSALISVRARGEYSRPFTLVEEIREEAEREYAEEAQRLEAERREAEARLRELQSVRPDSGDVILTPEQRAELERFRDRLAATNAQLRDVNFNLRRDVERLGLTLEVVNIAAAPALVALVAIGLAGYRSAKRRADRRAIAGAG